MNIFGTKEKIAMIFDIGSASVGGAVVSFSPKASPKILASVREEMVFQENLEFDRFVSALKDALGRVCSSLQKRHTPGLGGLSLFSEKIFFCSFSSPWYASQTRMASVQAEKPFTITKSFLSETLEKEVRDFEESEAKRFGEGVIIERELMQVKLNGYKTKNPVGKKATGVEISVCVSIIPEKISRLVQKTIGSAFHLSHLQSRSFPFIAFAVLTERFGESDFLFIDISGETTDVSLVHGGVLQETASFPYGKNFIFRALMRELSLTYAEAVSALALHQSGIRQGKTAEDIKKVLAFVSDKWTGEFRGALATLSSTGKWLPLKIFFTADTDMFSWFLKCLESENAHPGGAEGQKFQVKGLPVSFFADERAAQGTPPDAFLALLVEFLEMRISGHISEKEKEKEKKEYQPKQEQKEEEKRGEKREEKEEGGEGEKN